MGNYSYKSQHIFQYRTLPTWVGTYYVSNGFFVPIFPEWVAAAQLVLPTMFHGRTEPLIRVHEVPAKLLPWQQQFWAFWSVGRSVVFQTFKFYVFGKCRNFPKK